eukprot:gene2263-2437_t
MEILTFLPTNSLINSEEIEEEFDFDSNYIEVMASKANELQDFLANVAATQANDIQEYYIPIILTKGNEFKERIITIAATQANDLQEKYIPNIITKGNEIKEQIITQANQLAHPEELIQAGINHVLHVLPHLTVLLSVAFVLLLSSPIWIVLWILNLIIPLKYILIFTGEVSFVQLSSWWAIPTLFDAIFILFLEKPLTCWGFFKGNKGYLLEKASQRMRKHESIVDFAIENNPWELKYASNKLRKNSKIVLRAVEKNGLTLQFASKELRSDLDVVFEAIKSKGLALKFSSPNLTDHHRLVLNAVKQNGLAIKYASKNCKDNYLIATSAVKKNSKSYRFVSSRLKESTVILMLKDKISPEIILENGIKKLNNVSFSFQ